MRQVWKYSFTPSALIDKKRVNEDKSLEEDFVLKGALGMWILNGAVTTHVLNAHAHDKGDFQLRRFQTLWWC